MPEIVFNNPESWWRKAMVTHAVTTKYPGAGKLLLVFTQQDIPVNKIPLSVSPGPSAGLQQADQPDRRHDERVGPHAVPLPSAQPR